MSQHLARCWSAHCKRLRRHTWPRHWPSMVASFWKALPHRASPLNLNYGLCASANGCSSWRSSALRPFVNGNRMPEATPPRWPPIANCSSWRPGMKPATGGRCCCWPKAASAPPPWPTLKHVVSSSPTSWMWSRMRKRSHSLPRFSQGVSLRRLRQARQSCQPILLRRPSKFPSASPSPPIT